MIFSFKFITYLFITDLTFFYLSHTHIHTYINTFLSFNFYFTLQNQFENTW